MDDAVGPLTALPKTSRRKADPRRQSVALFQAFNKTSSGSGLLEGEEIAVGDEDIQVPLEKSGRLLGMGNCHSHIWLEPGVDELLENDLPSPDIITTALKAGAGRECPAGVCQPWASRDTSSEQHHPGFSLLQIPPVTTQRTAP